MKVAKFLYFAAPFLIGAGILIALHPTLTRTMGATSVAAGAKVSEKTARRAPAATASLSNEAAARPDPRVEELRMRIEELKNQGLYDAALWDEFFRLTTSEKPSGGRLDQGGETCASAQVIAGLPYHDTGTTSGYANDYEVTGVFTCPYTSTSPDVVYKYTPTTNETVDINLCNSGYDTKVFVFQGSCVNANVVGCDDDGCGSSYRSVIHGLALTAYNDYYIVVDGYGGASGTYALDVTLPPPPPECPPGSLFSQTPTDAAGAWNAFTSDNNTYPFDYIVYENFWGLTSYTCDLHWWGLMLQPIWYDCPGENPMTFDIGFYQDAAGLPGAQVGPTLTIPVLGVSTGIFYAGYTMYSFSMALTPCVGLAAGWVSIQGVSTGSPDCAFLWMNSPVGDLVSYQYDGATMNPLSDNLAFCLTGTGELLGACCDPSTGSCVDNVPAATCQSPSIFYANMTCAQINCGMGACCDPVTGACTQTTYANCTGSWLAATGCNPNPCPQLAGSNRTTLTRTFRNISAVPAYDFRAKTSHGTGSIDNASAYKPRPSRERVFPDRLFPSPVSEFVWPRASNLIIIPVDSTMEVNVSGEKPALDADSCWFTDSLGGRLNTDCVANAPRVVPKRDHYGRDCGGGSVEFCNAFYSETVLLTGVEVRVNNTGDPGEIGPYIPDGTLVPGIPSSFSLAPGETLSFPYTGADPLLAVSMSDTAALASSPDDGYYELMAASPVAFMVPDNVTISYNSGTGNVEIHWLDVGEGLSYKIYRATDDPSGPFMLIGTVPAGVQFYADFAGVNDKAFYYVTGSCD